MNELHTVRDYIRYGVSLFTKADIYYGHGTDNALDESVNLVLHAIQMPHELPGHFMESRLVSEEKAAVLDLLHRRVDERIPAAYLIGEAWFAGMVFDVDERVLVPRSPFAELIETHFEPWVDPQRVARILDMCTGSGCIGMASAQYFPEAQVDCADISKDALEVATKNLERHHLAEQVRLIESDLFQALKGETYDLIVSNPPYVDAGDLAAMPKEFEHEPALGLGSGEDGLEATNIILREAADHLNEGGVLIVEVGASAGNLEDRYPDVPFTWLEFERGGDGVFIFTREQLQEYGEFFQV
jgi:ribosomal protein L3 glutamine methyltransferase